MYIVISNKIFGRIIMKNIKQIVKKITVTCAALALCFANVAMYSPAYSNSNVGSVSNQTVSYTGCTVLTKDTD